MMSRPPSLVARNNVFKVSRGREEGRPSVEAVTLLTLA